MNLNDADIIWVGNGQSPFTFRVKKKMERGGSFVEWENGNGFDATWEGAFANNPVDPPHWNRSSKGHWGYLCIVVWIDDTWFAWDIADLSPMSATNIRLEWKDVVFGSLPEKLNIQRGDWIGFFIMGHSKGKPLQTDVRSDILSVQYQGEYFEEIEEEEEKNLKGTPWFKITDYPQFVMAPIAPLLTVRKAQDIYQEFIVETGFDGFHVPLQGQWSDGVTKLMDLSQEHGFLVHFWLYGDRQNEPLAPKDPNAEGPRAWQAEVMQKLTPYSWWTMGLGFDLQEWASQTDVQSWVEFMKVGLMMPQEFGGRINVEYGPYSGQFASIEYQVHNKDEFRLHLLELVEEEPARPVITADRFRVHPDYRSKDWTPEQVVEGIKQCREVGVAAIWGYGTNVSDLGSSTWPNKEAIRAALGKEPVDLPPPPQPTLWVSIMPGLVEIGGVVTIIWGATDTHIVEWSSNKHGPIDFSLPAEGTRRHAVLEDTIYTLRALGDGGQVEVRKLVTVLEKKKDNKSWWIRFLEWFAS